MPSDIGALDRLRRLWGQPDSLNRRGWIAGNNDLPLHAKGPLPRRLLRRLVRDAIVDIVVQFVERDAPVSIQVSFPRLQPVNQGLGEN